MGLLCMRGSQAVERRRGDKAPPSERGEGEGATSHQTQPYETSASRVVGVLVSELVLLLADSVQLGGLIFPKETGVQG